jgi:hypothetical protein
MHLPQDETLDKIKHDLRPGGSHSVPEKSGLTVINYIIKKKIIASSASERPCSTLVV